MNVFGKLDRLWHTHVKKHAIEYFPPLVPDDVVRASDGSPLINVFTQETFQAPMEHWECSCGVAWM